MSDIEQQAVSIIREWTSITREHAALLAMKLNNAGLLVEPVDERDLQAYFEAWQKNQVVKNGQ